MGSRGFDYAFVHLFWTVPPAVVLTSLYYPLQTAVDVYKVAFLVLIAVVSTIPWDSYLVRNRVWTYPNNVIIGPTLFQIPAEEVFFFVVQTYNTSLLYLLLSKPTFHSIYLRGERLLRNGPRITLFRWLGTLAIMASIAGGTFLVANGGQGLYMGLISVWAGPFVLLLWSLAHQFILELPLSNTLLPIAIPTVYLWIVDTLALRRGTWVIQSETKLGLHLWDGLEIEEALFFLVTNVLIVFGLLAFDNALAVLQTFPALFPSVPALPSPILLVKALLIPTSAYDDDRIDGLQQSLARLKEKSRSFYLASGVFRGRLRIDLILLYSFCRVADDLVDDAATTEDARGWISSMVRFLDLSYSENKALVPEFVTNAFPPSAQKALLLLPTQCLSSQPLYDLLKGFETDLHFKSVGNPFPIKDQSTLELYSARVAGTVAEACIELVYFHTTASTSPNHRKQIIQAGGRMGTALQYINIARDVSVDAWNSRVYLPTDWLKAAGLTSEDIVREPTCRGSEALRQRLLDSAMYIYEGSREAIERLPHEARGPMRVAVESYVEIARVLREPEYSVKAGRATVPKWRRLHVAWKSLNR